MANSNEAQSKTPSNTTPTNPLPHKMPATDGQTSPLLFPILATALAGLALALAMYTSYTNHQARLLDAQESQTLEHTLDNLKQQQEELRASLRSDKANLNQTQTSLENHVQELGKNLQAALQQRLYQKQDWLLLKARYYLELAQINAHWSGDQQATIALLQQADSLLASIADQHLYEVRQAIAKEISQVQALPRIDLAGLLSKLDAAQTLAASLPLKQPIEASPIAVSEKNEAQPTSSSWRERFKNSIQSLEKLVIIRRHDEAIEPLLSPVHQRLLRDTIQLNLQEAQWAVLQNNSQVYQLALNQAMKNINKGFDENASATQALLKQLQALEEKKLSQAKPVLDKALPLLNHWIESKKAQPIDTPTTTEGTKTP